MDDVVVRYNIPTKFDKGSYGQVAKVVEDRGECSYYIQTSKDPETIHWVRSGLFFEQLYNYRLKDETKLKYWLDLYHNRLT